MIGCGSSSKTLPVTQSNSVAFLQEAPSAGTYMFSPMIGTFTTKGTTTTFSSAAVMDKSTNQPLASEIYSIVLSADATKATFDLYGGLDGTSYQWDIWVGNASGTSNPTQVTNDNNWNRMPQFSPDASKVVFISDRMGSDGNYHDTIVIRNADGTGDTPLPLPSGAENAWAPTFSPDGTRIAAEIASGS